MADVRAEWLQESLALAIAWREMIRPQGRKQHGGRNAR